jgi:hypothetical protein
LRVVPTPTNVPTYACPYRTNFSSCRMRAVVSCPVGCGLIQSCPASSSRCLYHKQAEAYLDYQQGLGVARTNRTRRVPHPVLIGHAASLTPYHRTSPSSARPRASPSRHAPCPHPSSPSVQTGRASLSLPYIPDARYSPPVQTGRASLPPLRTNRACMSPRKPGVRARAARRESPATPKAFGVGGGVEI